MQKSIDGDRGRVLATIKVHVNWRRISWMNRECTRMNAKAILGLGDQRYRKANQPSRSSFKRLWPLLTRFPASRQWLGAVQPRFCLVATWGETPGLVLKSLRDEDHSSRRPPTNHPFDALYACSGQASHQSRITLHFSRSSACGRPRGELSFSLTWLTRLFISTNIPNTPSWMALFGSLT